MGLIGNFNLGLEIVGETTPASVFEKLRDSERVIVPTADLIGRSTNSETVFEFDIGSLVELRNAVAGVRH